MGVGIYLHIPFCVRKCEYCDFLSYEDMRDTDLYAESLIQEIVLSSRSCQHGKIDTVFIGGGTPSVMPPAKIGSIMSALRSNYEISSDAEITIETNPGTLDTEKLRQYRDCGINRISLGLQSADDMLLKTLGRIHGYSDFARSIEMTEACGYTNINIDLMYGIPYQNAEILCDTLEKVFAFYPAHISLYSLIVEDDTPLKRKILDGTLCLPNEDETAFMQDAADSLLNQNGCSRYEISNYAKPGFECRHNLNYWNNGQYIGLGLGAHSAISKDATLMRTENTREFKSYFAAIKDGKLPVSNTMLISEKEEMFETIMLGLRKTDGISIEDFNCRFECDFLTLYQNQIKSLQEKNLLKLQDKRVFLTSKGLDLQNRVLIDFM